MSRLFWTEGTIDAIAVGTGVSFLLVLSAAALVECAGEKRALFVGGGEEGGVTKNEGEKNLLPAKVVKCTKNREEKECLWFSFGNPENMVFFLAVKSARGSVRLGLEKLPVGKGLDCQSALAVSRLMVV